MDGLERMSGNERKSRLNVPELVAGQEILEVWSCFEVERWIFVL